MSQTWEVDDIDVNITSPAQAWPKAIDGLDALRTGFSGATRPTDTAAGQIWIDTDYAANTWAVYRVVDPDNAALDAMVGTIDTTTGMHSPVVANQRITRDETTGVLMLEEV